MPSGAWALLYMYGEPTSVRGLPYTYTSYSLRNSSIGLRHRVAFRSSPPWLTMALQAVPTGRPPKKGR